MAPRRAADIAEVAEREQLHAVAGRADLFVDLEAALHRVDVERAEGAVMLPAALGRQFMMVAAGSVLLAMIGGGGVSDSGGRRRRDDRSGLSRSSCIRRCGRGGDGAIRRGRDDRRSGGLVNRRCDRRLLRDGGHAEGGDAEDREAGKGEFGEAHLSLPIPQPQARDSRRPPAIGR
jgi:hypothetical protein